MNKGEKLLEADPSPRARNPSVWVGRKAPCDTQRRVVEAIARVASGVPVSPKSFAQGGPPSASRRDPLPPAEAGTSPHRMAVQSGQKPDRLLATCKGTFPPFLATRHVPKGLNSPEPSPVCTDS